MVRCMHNNLKVLFEHTIFCVDCDKAWALKGEVHVALRDEKPPLVGDTLDLIYIDCDEEVK